MSTFTTTNRHGYSAKFSTFNSNVAVASSQLYGLAGGGTLYILENSIDNHSISELRQYQWTDGLFDVVWSPNNENILATCSGDGKLHLWDLESHQKLPVPISTYSEHTSEVYSLDWGGVWNSNQILSSSWDGTLKIWDPNYSAHSLLTWNYDSESIVYSAAFAPHIANIFASVSTNGSLNFWNSLDFSGKSVATINGAHLEEILTCSWSPLNQWLIATGGSDGLIKGWDIRYLNNDSASGGNLFELLSCDYAVRRICFSPFLSSILVSANFDCTTKIWDFMEESESTEPLETITNHSEFVYGVDWNSQCRNQIIDCGWDSKVNIFIPKSLQNY